jgi:sugar lactone lactonase YvrE
MGMPDVFDERRCDLGEGPHYDERTGRVWWVDVFAPRILWRDSASARSAAQRSTAVASNCDSASARSAAQRSTAVASNCATASGEQGELPMPAHVSAAVPRRTGGLVACLPDGAWLVDADGAVRPLARYPAGVAGAAGAAGAAGPAGAPTLRSNDAKADPSGRLWLGTMAYDQTPGAGALYRLDANGSLARKVPDVTVSNGLGWSPDASTMYYIDTPTRRIDSFPYDIETGELGERRVFAEVNAGFPDGLCVDAEGGVWVALWEGSGIQRYAPDGRLDRMIKLPTPRVTSCAFAGDRFQTLIITTAAHGRPDDPAAGLTYAYEPGDVVGTPVDRYAG